jgi:glycosyltransferase involved in cell wall biosynthesis
VNARFSADIEDIGSFHTSKVLLLLGYCLEAIWCRFRYGVRAFYYVPAPGKRAALYRDWIVMLLCRPFFRQIIHHWHAVGLGDWLQSEGTWLERRITRRLLGRPALGIALTIPGMRDALWFRSRRVEVVPNGIPDPCPDFETTLLPIRRARSAARRELLKGESPAGTPPEILRVLFLSLCTPEKGLFDTLEGVAIANRSLRETRAPWSIHLTVVGTFISAEDETRFHARAGAADLAGTVTYAGFVGGEAKSELLRASDTLCFPTYYAAESFGLVLVEAMAAGLSVVATQWRANAEVLPVEYPGLVPVNAPACIAASLIRSFAEDATGLRAHMLKNYTERRFVETLRQRLDAVLNEDAGWQESKKSDGPR